MGGENMSSQNKIEILIDRMLDITNKYMQLIESQFDSDSSTSDYKKTNEMAKTLYCFAASVRALGGIDEKIFIQADFVQQQVEKLISTYEPQVHRQIDDTLKAHTVQISDIEEINQTMYYLKSALGTLKNINSIKTSHHKTPKD